MATSTTAPLTNISLATQAIQALLKTPNFSAQGLGTATEDVKENPDTVGYRQMYQQGAIYWSPTTGACAVHGAIFQKWASMGYEKSSLGYPTTNELGSGPTATAVLDNTPQRTSYFQNGSITWNQTTGPVVQGVAMLKATAAVPSFHIEKIRSQHTDTLYATSKIQVYSESGKLLTDLASVTEHFPDHGSGDTVQCNAIPPVNLEIPMPSSHFSPGGLLVWTFTINNSNQDSSSVISTVDKAATALATALSGDALKDITKSLTGAFGIGSGSGSSGGSSGSGTGSGDDSSDGDSGGTGKTDDSTSSSLEGAGILLAAAAAVEGLISLINFLTANCNGYVFQYSWKLRARDLFDQIVPERVWSPKISDPGTDSPAGCGGNSHYTTTFEFRETPLPPGQHPTPPGPRPAPPVLPTH